MDWGGGFGVSETERFGVEGIERGMMRKRVGGDD